MENPQTTQFCQKLGIQNPFRPTLTAGSSPPLWLDTPPHNPDEIPLDSSDEESDSITDTPSQKKLESKSCYPWLEDSSGDEETGMESGPINPVEIPLHDSDDECGKSVDRNRALDCSVRDDKRSNVETGNGGTEAKKPKILRRNIATYGSTSEDT